MRVLMIAPQPFYQERGTPIAVRLAVEALSRKLPLISGDRCAIDLLVYNEGNPISIPGVRIIRGAIPSWLKGVRPGISCKKLICDLFLFLHALVILLRTRHQRYDVIHAVEESVFFAWIAKRLLGIPYIYDMDSSLALQVTERWWWCRPALALFQKLEGLAVRGAIAVAPVCEELRDIAQNHGAATTVMLRDVSLIDSQDGTRLANQREHVYDTAITSKHIVILYVGNLEPYQGIDLLIESFASIKDQHPDARLVIVGGTKQLIDEYRKKSARLLCESSTFFLGPRPLESLGTILRAADIVASPRIKGNNTPMKIYSYLHSGTPIIATDLPTHRQVLNESVALLAPAVPEAFGSALSMLIKDAFLRSNLGKEAQAIAERLYTAKAFEDQVAMLYRLASQGKHTDYSKVSDSCSNL